MSIPKQTKAAAHVEETTRRINLWRIKRMHAQALAVKAALENALTSRTPLRRPEPGASGEEGRPAVKPAGSVQA